MNLRASAIVMKSLPATAWGDALLISREEARRIGYELEQAADRIEALEASATPVLPQAEHDLEDVRCQCCGYMTYHREHMGCIRSAYKQALPQVPEGMAIVPVETLKNAERYAWLKAHIIEQPTARSLMIESSEHKTEYVFPKLISWADFCGPITLDEAIDFKLAATKEKGE